MGNNIISSLGAGSGIDVSGLVDGLVAVEKAPLEGRLDSRQEKLETQISAYGVLKSSLSEFQGVLKPLSEADTFNARSVSFPDSDVITPDKLEANAQVGAYQVEVLGVAQSQSLATEAISDTGAALGAGDITFRFGEWDSYTAPADPVLGRPSGFAQNADKDALTISLDDDDSLQDLVRKINEADVDLQASIIQTDGQSQMLLTAPSGAKNAIQITAPDHAQFAFEDGVDSQLIQTQAASDATLQINGLDVSRESNNIDDVIPGLSFSVNKASVGEKITFSISEDSSTGEQAVRDFVEAYNSLYETLKNLTGTSTDAETDEVTVGGLSKDGSAKNMLSQIRQMMNSVVPGIDSGFSALSNIGIRTELDGTIEIIEDEFKDAIDNNFDQVASLFSPESSASKSSLSVGYGSSIDKAVAGTYNVDVTQEPTKGTLNGSDGVNFTDLNTESGEKYSFTINVDGVESNSIVLPDGKTYADEAALATELQSLINGDSSLKAVGAAVDVSYNSDDQRFEFSSRQYGSISAVSFSDASDDMATVGITAALVGTEGQDAAGFIYNSDTTKLTQGTLSGATGVTVSNLDAGAGDYSFTIDVDGVTSGSIVLDETYADGEALAADLQSKINSDSLLKAAGTAVDVNYNSTDGRFEFTSRMFGASSSIDVSVVSADMASLGITAALTGTAGTGNADGMSAFGAGNVLLPAVGSDPYGLTLIADPGSLGSSSFSFSRGLAGEMSLLIDSLLSSSGSIKAREDSINDQLEDIELDRESLDNRMVKVEARLLSQFLAMERIISSLNATSDSLDGILDRLPFTAQKS